MRQLLVLLTLAFSCGDPRLNRVRPQLESVASPLDFGTVPVLNEKRLEVPLINTGRATLVLSNVALASQTEGFVIVSAPAEVAGGATETLTVAFTPATENPSATTLSFATNDESSPHVEVALIGLGSTRAIASVAPSTLDFGKVGECTSALATLSITASGTADLLIQDISFTPETVGLFAFVGSTKTPAVVKRGSTLQLTVRLNAAQGADAVLNGAVHVTTTDPDQRDVVVPMHATVNRAPVPVIAPLGNAALGQSVTLDGSASTDADGDMPLKYTWLLRTKPLASTTSIREPSQPSTAMTLDSTIPGVYDVQLEVTDASGVKSCMPAKASVVAAPAQKLLVEMFWDNAGTDLDVHVLRTPTAPLSTMPDDCFFQNRTPDWGILSDVTDDPVLVRDALVGYGPEVFGYVNPVDGTYRVAVVFANALLNAKPSSTATVRVYAYGVLKAEVSKTLARQGDSWSALDITWPSGDVKVVP